MSFEQNSNGMSYEQFQEQVRIRREQEMLAAKQALRQAGADSQSERERELLNSFNEIRNELQLAENQVQVQLDAQFRQLKRIKDRIDETEASIRSYVTGPLSH